MEQASEYLFNHARALAANFQLNALYDWFPLMRSWRRPKDHRWCRLQSLCCLPGGTCSYSDQVYDIVLTHLGSSCDETKKSWYLSYTISHSYPHFNVWRLSMYCQWCADWASWLVSDFNQHLIQFVSRWIFRPMHVSEASHYIHKKIVDKYTFTVHCKSVSLSHLPKPGRPT